MRKQLTTLIALLAVLALIPAATGEMTSTSYQIPSSVISAGGMHMTSTSYASKATLGQSSPLIELDELPFSDSYDLYPGFWYTIAYYEIPKRSKSLPLILLLLNE
jgi:hypothetical protein